jgi:hypothetical protein
MLLILVDAWKEEEKVWVENAMHFFAPLRLCARIPHTGLGLKELQFQKRIYSFLLSEMMTKMHFGQL